MEFEILRLRLIDGYLVGRVITSRGFDIGRVALVDDGHRGVRATREEPPGVALSASRARFSQSFCARTCSLISHGNSACEIYDAPTLGQCWPWNIVRWLQSTGSAHIAC